MIESTDTELDIAFETLYRFAAAGLTDPRRDLSDVLFDPGSRELAMGAADVVRSVTRDQTIPLGFGELPIDDLDLPPALAALGDDPEQHTQEYLRIFGLVTCRECPPYETEYYPNQDPFFRSQQMADVAGFYRAFGLEPARQWRECPDHITLELEYVATLLARLRSARASAADPDQALVCHDARVKFLRDHVCWWVPSFSVGLRNQAEHGFFSHLGRILAALLPADRHRLQLTPPAAPVMPGNTTAPAACDGCGLP